MPKIQLKLEDILDYHRKHLPQRPHIYFNEDVWGPILAVTIGSGFGLIMGACWILEMMCEYNH